MLIKGVTLRGLEVFEALAATGSVAQTAELTGLSQPAVSQQIRNLENALGVHLVDHGRRPMTLTNAGRGFLARTQAVLSQLRIAQNELTVMDLSHISQLSLGIIDDFDNDLTPRLVTILAENMTQSQFKLVSAPSLDISREMKAGNLHLAIVATSGASLEGVTNYPLAEDPFILVAPRGAVAEHGSPDAMMEAMPMLRYDSAQLIGQQVEAHLAREKLSFPQRFEIGAHQSLMTLISRRVGWTLSTPLGFMRAERFHDEIEAHPLPFTPFSRQIVLQASSDWTDTVPRDVARTVCSLMQDLVIERARRQLPWLENSLRLIEG